MHLYNDMEIDMWGYLTGPPFGDVILEDALRIIRPSMTLRGNIDQVEFLRQATPAQVKQRVRELLEKVKPRGNWVLSTTDFPFNGNIPTKTCTPLPRAAVNLAVMREAGRRRPRPPGLIFCLTKE